MFFGTVSIWYYGYSMIVKGWNRNVADLCRFFLVGPSEKTADGFRRCSGCRIILFLGRQVVSL